MSNLLPYLAHLDPNEAQFVHHILNQLDDDQVTYYLNAYNAQRKDANLTLIFSLVGIFTGIAGLQRFYTGQIGMGILYLFTAGFCGIGSIVDAITHKKLTNEYNMRKANEVAHNLHMLSAANQ